MTVVHLATERRHQANRTTHVVAEYRKTPASPRKLRRIELWHAPSFPFGVVRYSATFDGTEPFELETYAFGNGYESDLPLSLDEVRLLTANDRYGSIPPSGS